MVGWIKLYRKPPPHTNPTKLERLKTDQRKAELKARIIRYFNAGYTLLFYTPVLSISSSFVVYLAYVFAYALQSNIMPDMMLTAWNVSIVILAIIGIALYLYGYLRREAIGETRSEVITLSFFLIAWGVLTCVIAPTVLNFISFFQSTDVEIRAPTMWNHIAYWTWELKGIFGIGIGLLPIITLLLKRPTQQTQN